MPVFDHFGLLAPIYDRLIRLRESERLVSMADLPVPGALLDAGGGTGRVAGALLGLAAPIVVADLSAGMLRQARAKDGLEAVNSHAELLPFPDGFFDRVIMVDALHHVCDQAATARELWRVLKPGGRLVIEEPDVRTFIVKIVAVLEKLALMRSHFLSPREIAALFPYPAARTTIRSEGFNAWVIIKK